MADIVDVLFSISAAACAALLLYGGWLCLCHGRDARCTKSLVAIAATVSSMGAPHALAETIFEEAMQDYERGSYVAAHLKFRSAAERGDARAQEIVGLMYAFGPQLYPGIPQELHTAALWLDRAARAGRPVARYAYCALAKTQVPRRFQGWQCFDRIAETGEPLRVPLPFGPGR